MMVEDSERVWVITKGEYSDYGIDAVLIGPADAQMHLLKAAHEAARRTTTYRDMGYVAVRRTNHVSRHKEPFFFLCRPGEVNEYAPAMTDEVIDGPKMDDPVDDYDWSRIFHLWLVQTQGFRDAEHETFHIDGY